MFAPVGQFCSVVSRDVASIFSIWMGDNVQLAGGGKERRRYGEEVFKCQAKVAHVTFNHVSFVRTQSKGYN